MHIYIMLYINDSLTKVLKHGADISTFFVCFVLVSLKEMKTGKVATGFQWQVPQFGSHLTKSKHL